MTAALTCRKTHSLETGSVYAWETAEGATGNVLIDLAEAVARPCTPEGAVLGEMLLAKDVGNTENPDPDPEIRRAFLIAASVIFQEGERQGRLPDTIRRTYW
ncbi:hypothetical protein [Streptomyces nodosus]|uniref:Uncharacterized protein n=1 Tax=Streptomyces nodosus TaxID=40318 RepID=A0A0B5DIB7_9ACTN|nr:hypothetical protein [Streptomyces nodosus]AJE39712.1 hypothetical protein SNOD_06545 [Streptomyces nodosus]MBB4790687.1 hypothetical protein [Streptomyces nodosus]QEV38304.1 hypothetical protein CP978_06885 [Streptomyces nodosus]